jgi:hypothetical protein
MVEHAVQRCADGRPQLDWTSWEGTRRLWIANDATVQNASPESVEAAWRRLFNEDVPEPVGPTLASYRITFTPYVHGRVVVCSSGWRHSIWQLPAGRSLRAKAIGGVP